MKRWEKKSSGFTIIELLVVIVVIGILAAIIIVGYGLVQNNAHDTGLKADLTKIGESIHLKVLDDQTVPAGGATSLPSGDPTVFSGVTIHPDQASYDLAVANLYYCSGKYNGGNEFALIARGLTGNVFKYMSVGGLSQITTSLTWGTDSNGPAVCVAAGFTGSYTWSYGYNPDPAIHWYTWATP